MAALDSGQLSRHLRWARRERSLADLVPVLGHVDRQTVALAHGEFARVWRVAGTPFETVERAVAEARFESYHQLTRLLGQARLGLYVHRIRRRVPPPQARELSNPVCAEIERRYCAALAQQGLFRTEHYLTIVQRGQDRPDVPFSGRRPQRAHAGTGRLERMAELSYEVERSLDYLHPVALGTYDRDGILHSEVLEFFAELLNGIPGRVAVPAGRAGSGLATARLFVGPDRLELRGLTERRFVALLTIQDYPEWSAPGMLDGLLYGSSEFIETHSFLPLRPREAGEFLVRQRNQFVSAEDGAQSQIDALAQARDDVISGRFLLGEYHYTLALWADSLETLSPALGEARTTLQERGLQPAVVDLIPDAAWFAQLPGNERYRPRWARLTSRNFCALAPLHGFPEKSAGHVPWEDPVTWLRSPSGTLERFDFHLTSALKGTLTPANTLVVGQTGSGKTVAVLFLLAQLASLAPAVVLFDKDRASELLIRSLGGTYIVFEPGRNTGIRPFAGPVSEYARGLWSLFVRALFEGGGAALTEVERSVLEAALEALAHLPGHLRSISVLKQLLPHAGPQSLGERIAKWCEGGPLAWAFDGSEEDVFTTAGHIIGFDYTAFLDLPELRSPTLTILLCRVLDRMDGRRLVYAVSECWRALSDPGLVEFLNDRQRTIRKFNGFGIFDTQSPRDLLESPVARALIEQAATLICLPNPQADRDDYVEGLKLTETEFELIRQLPVQGRSFLIKQEGRSRIVSLDLAGLGPFLTLLSGDPKKSRVLETLQLHSPAAIASSIERFASDCKLTAPAESRR